MYATGRRSYSPTLGRWINRDPIGERGGVNVYGFVDNRSISLFDFLGRQSALDPSGLVLLKEPDTAYDIETGMVNISPNLLPKILIDKTDHIPVPKPQEVRRAGGGEVEATTRTELKCKDDNSTPGIYTKDSCSGSCVVYLKISGIDTNGQTNTIWARTEWNTEVEIYKPTFTLGPCTEFTVPVDSDEVRKSRCVRKLKGKCRKFEDKVEKAYMAPFENYPTYQPSLNDFNKYWDYHQDPEIPEIKDEK